MERDPPLPSPPALGATAATFQCMILSQLCKAWVGVCMGAWGSMLPLCMAQRCMHDDALC